MTAYRIKDVTRINRRILPEDTDPGYTFKYIDISGVDGIGNIDIPNEHVTFAAAPSRARRLAPNGAVLVSTVRTYLRAIAAVPVSQDPLVFSTGFAVLEAGPEIESRFLGYYCHSQPFVDDIVARSTGVSYPAINASEIGNLAVPLPPLEQQRRIADFLDAETARIDRLAERYQKLSDLAVERARAVIDKALMGLSAESSVPASAVCSAIVDCVNKTAPTSTEATPYRMIRTSNIRNGEVNLSETFSVERRVFIEWNRRGTPRNGDILFTREAPLGQVGMLHTDASVFLGQRIMLYRANENVLKKELLLYNFLGSHMGRQLRLLGAGSLHEHVRVGDCLKLRIYCPPRTQQDGLVAEIEAGREKSLRLATLAKRQLALLAERRQALITAAVTGQFDVSTASGRNVTDGVTA
ncbi:restriction endonuclease subunit S [Streptomyces sp. NBC_01232]|uniref:restriction endonuclease subunit S n=1 Tax=Streptomyces sp. NBC_01232 TaxID=2903786 RepID=UPI002E1654F4|nr:restriction endonuclease subunit S [Streptomyces sp. NBC_01232]